jgi:hypothetical protein
MCSPLHIRAPQGHASYDYVTELLIASALTRLVRSHRDSVFTFGNDHAKQPLETEDAVFLYF